MIGAYRFGEVTVRDTRYTHDVVIHADGIKSWWRAKSHEVCPDDIEDAVNTSQPDVIVIGSGDSEMMAVSSETRHWLESKGIDVIVAATGDACEIYNGLCGSRNVVAALHLTC